METGSIQLSVKKKWAKYIKQQFLRHWNMLRARWKTNDGPLQLLQLKSLGNSSSWCRELEPRQPVTFPKWRRWSWEFGQSKVTRVNRTEYRKGENYTKKPGDLQWSPPRIFNCFLISYAYNKMYPWSGRALPQMIRS